MLKNDFTEKCFKNDFTENFKEKISKIDFTENSKMGKNFPEIFQK